MSKIAMNKKYLIDGSNLFCYQSGDGMRLVAACIMALEKRFILWNIIFDANINHKIESSDDAELLREIQKRWANGVHICPAGNQADDFILLQADAEGWDVISNDRFRDNAEKYRWVADKNRATRRLHKFMVSATGNLGIPDLGIFSEIPKLPSECFNVSTDIIDKRNFALSTPKFESIDQLSNLRNVDHNLDGSIDETLKKMKEFRKSLQKDPDMFKPIQISTPNWATALALGIVASIGVVNAFRPGRDYD